MRDSLVFGTLWVGLFGLVSFMARALGHNGGAETSAEHLSIARAIENRIYVVTCNRTGSERGFDFIGRSKIIDPSGKVLACTNQDFDHEEVISANIDPEQSRKKRLVLIPGRYEIDVMGCRQPDLYRELGTS